MPDLKVKVIYKSIFIIKLSLLVLLVGCDTSNKTPEKVQLKSGPAKTESPINRKQVVQRHNPSLKKLDPQSPFSLGNGQFAFTADITGLQSFPNHYFQKGIPLETKARWAWHSRANPQQHKLKDANETYPAYGREVNFPTNMSSPAGQWLRKNPHDQALARIGFIFNNQPLEQKQLTEVSQHLDLWSGILHSEFTLMHEQVRVKTLVHSESDTLSVQVNSNLLGEGKLAVKLHFPRSYDMNVKNTPDILFNEDEQHKSEIQQQSENHALFRRSVDDAVHFAKLQWKNLATLNQTGTHSFSLDAKTSEKALSFSLTFSSEKPAETVADFEELAITTKQSWQDFWQQGAFVDFNGSSHSQAHELERRIILSRYLMALQSRALIPTQETGLTNSSWYGKHHTEMTWWHYAHWALWGQTEEVEKVLNWYKQHLPGAQNVAQERGLEGARWAKMVGPHNRESPGGNPLIIWNQAQFIHLAEMLYTLKKDDALIEQYAELVEQSAAAMASMLVWDDKKQHYSLDAPIWIAQEIYEPTETLNPTFELAYWRHGLTIAQHWRKRQKREINAEWQIKLDQLAPLPVKNNKYVAIESIPDTFDNIASRQDHPSMLAAFGLLNDSSVDKTIMQNTLSAVLESWDWEKKIWGWDYPMIAMTASRLQQTNTAVDILLAKRVHNHYLPNGHVPQAGAALRVYLPANGALLSAVAMMIGGWEGAPERPFPGFPEDGRWQLKAEGFSKFD